MSSYAFLRHAYTVVYGGIMFNGVPPPVLFVVWVCEPPLKLTVWVWFDAVDVEPVHPFAPLKLMLFTPPPSPPAEPTLYPCVVTENAPLVENESAEPKGSLSVLTIEPVMFIEPLVCECEPLDDVVAEWV